MSVYVDPLVNYGAPSGFWSGRPSCHLFADTLDELHAFAARLALKPRWFQDRPNFPHYDLTAGRRARAVRSGAIEVDRRFVAQRMRTIAGGLASSDAAP